MFSGSLEVFFEFITYLTIMVYYFAFLCLAIIANAAVSSKSLDSDISILIHNDLIGTHIAYPPKLESGIKD